MNADILDLPSRSCKPREVGVTMVMDRGLSHGELANLIEAASPYFDYVKFGWCTGLLTPCLHEKLDLLRRHDIGFWFGGTLFEAAYAQDRVDRLVGWLGELGVDLIEISDGSIEIPESDKLALIESLSKDFRVLSEVGSKDVETVIAPSQWILRMKQELAAGAFMVVAEGRESGRAGIYRRTGEVRMGVAPINPICRRNPSIPGLCRIASPTCARPFELSLPWSVRLSSAARRCILRTLPCDSSLPP